ncbi:CD99 antigen-like protein 2 isoform X2 [Echinops telfairi]|uniref:CD99 antigen-like protein 2 isoform X2 n=1 Tax=Echinops telfairi TaxID=9371 RepID=A0AC55CMH7_ECHTE|nr:CD99 antigen-like protein 2 isoform X2 [Echinops telfairi]
MAACRSAFLVGLAFSLATLAQRDDPSVHFFDSKTTPRTYPRKTDRWNPLTTTTTRAPAATKAPANLPDFNLEDALDDRNDLDDGHRRPSVGEGGFSDKELEEVLGGGDYKPDRNKGGGYYGGGGGGGGGGGEDSESGMSAETGTVAGIASALAMALIGAVSSYISYQQKKLCFRIQHAADGEEGLNADYAKGENLEAVVCEEPQVQYQALQTQSAEPPQQSEQPRI